MKSMIRNTLGTKGVTMYLPCGATEAEAFANAVLDGTFVVYEEASTIGTGLGIVDYVDVSVMIQNETTGEKGYLSFAIKSTKHEDDVIAALLTKTFNGVKADKVVIIGMSTRTL
ncbi:MAG: hypothetical protein WC656_03325 [Sulfurimonas sp.]|jgi:hypothetical protein